MSQKILLITKNYPPQIGGIENYAQELHRSLLREGYQVKLIKAWPRNEYLLSISSSHVFGKFFYSLSEVFRLGAFFFKSLFQGFYYARRSNIVWSLDGSIAGIGYFLSKFAHHTKYNQVNPKDYQCISRVTLHGTDVVWNNRIYQLFIPWFWRHTDEVITVSHEMKKEVAKRGVLIEKITVFEHSFQSMTFTDPGYFNRNEFLKSYNIPTEKTLLFSLGRFVTLKQFHWFLSEVMPKLDNHFHYVLGGFGPLEGEYRQIIKSKNLTNVSLIGPVRDSQEKAKWFTVVDYLIFPSYREGNPVTLLEATYYKLPVFLSSHLAHLEYKNQPGGRYLPAQASKWVDFLNESIHQ